MVRLRDKTGRGVRTGFRQPPDTLAVNVSLNGENVALTMDQLEDHPSDIPVYVLQSDGQEGGGLEMRRRNIETVCA
jgi:hypothetical protein